MIVKEIGEDFRKDYEYDERKDKIGSGSYGTVYRVTNKVSKEKRAIKLIDIELYKINYENSNPKCNINKIMNDYKNCVFKEINIMKVVEGENEENENTVKCYGYYYKKDIEIAIVMELCDENFGKMISNIEQKFTFEEIRKVLNQLNNSFKIMDKNKIAHRDLKPINILVKYRNERERNNFILKIGDYGEAKKLTMTKKLFSTKVGTFIFMAPEVLNKEKFDLKCDLWSLGMILYYLYFQEYPYDTSGEFQLFNEINNYGQKYFRKSGNKDFDDLISKLLIKDPKERISWEDYFNHPFIRINEILLTIRISKKEVNETIYFLNDSDGKGHKNEEITNLNKDDCELFINDNLSEFSRYFKPQKEGEYKIRIVFKKKIKNCSSMFSNNDNIIKIDLSSFDTSQVTSMYYMFGRCHYLKEVNLSNCHTNNVKDMSYLFNKCSYLKKIIFPKSFVTKNVENMSYMFNCCYELEDICFSPSFVTSKVKNMESMFSKCFKLEKLNLENFDTSEVTNIGYMFEQCSELKDILIDPNKFKTDKVVKMGRMFNSCKSLEHLNIKNFRYSNVKYINHMFQYCEKLKEIDLSGFNDIKDGMIMNEMFDNLKDVKVIVNGNVIEKFRKKFNDIMFITN